MKSIMLVCNAHIDPVWQWEWEEGLAETLSTFRVAASFCEEFQGFVFNHNEALLYQWVEEYDPALFRKIQKLVAQGSWHIMGGWYLQPDCNLPSGESIARQITLGREYFRKKFGVTPTVAANLDSFGHDRGLVQLLQKAGYDSYLVTRPPIAVAGLPGPEFLWNGYDGSAVKVHIADEGYGSSRGKVKEKIAVRQNNYPDKDPLLVLWGVGDHGGGPSFEDLTTIAQLRESVKQQGVELIHTAPEKYFATISENALPVVDRDLAPSMIGCYTSQVRIKQTHRKLENLLYQTEKMAVAAELQTGKAMDWEQLRNAEKTLLFHEFHDILPGSSIEQAEEASLEAMGGGIDQVKKVRMKALMALIGDCGIDTVTGEIPLFVYNPHPWPVRRTVECEFMMPDQNWSGSHTDYEVLQNGVPIVSQLIKERSNIALDWRKRLAFDLKLPPFGLVPLLCRPYELPARPVPAQPGGDLLKISAEIGSVTIDMHTGLIHDIEKNGVSYLTANAGQLVVLEDGDDPWKTNDDRYGPVVGKFELADADHAGQIVGTGKALAPVRIVEDGPVYTRIEAIFTYEQSYAVVTYTVTKADLSLSVDIRLYWMQPGYTVKQEWPTAYRAESVYAQAMFGQKLLDSNGRECPFQKWVSICADGKAVTIINTGSQAGDVANGVYRQTLLRSPGYCAHPIGDHPLLHDYRCLPRIDIGRRDFHFLLTVGAADQQLEAADRLAQTENEQPVALAVFPKGQEAAGPSFLQIDNTSILLSALKREAGEQADGVILRLFNSSHSPQSAIVKLPSLSIEATVKFEPFEVKTLKLKNNVLQETMLDESEIK